MTIATDIDRAIDAACEKGAHLNRMRLRMGPAARSGLAMAGHDSGAGFAEGFLVSYCSIPIEAVDAPDTDNPPDENRFHGWELLTDALP